MRYNKHGIPEDDRYKSPWLFVGLGFAVIIVTIGLIAGFIIIFQSC